jgi:dipeptidyl aminopeptidase/acylaminoacyl peptidase
LDFDFEGRAGLAIQAPGRHHPGAIAPHPSDEHSRGTMMSTSVGTRRGTIAALLLVLAASAAAPLSAQQPRPMTAQDLWSMARVGAPAVSPDGRSVVYTVTEYDLETDRAVTQLWLVPVSGGEPRQLTHGDASASSPAWSPDGSVIAFVSARNEDGRQLWLMPAGGGEPRQLTRIDGGVSGPVWSADGSRLAVASRVWAEDDEGGRRMRRLTDTGSSAQVYDELLHRHWDSWWDGRRSHVFAVDPATGEARDLTPGPYDTRPRGWAGSTTTT